MFSTGLSVAEYLFQLSSSVSMVMMSFILISILNKLSTEYPEKHGKYFQTAKSVSHPFALLTQAAKDAKKEKQLFWLNPETPYRPLKTLKALTESLWLKPKT